MFYFLFCAQSLEGNSNGGNLRTGCTFFFRLASVFFPSIFLIQKHEVTATARATEAGAEANPHEELWKRRHAHPAPSAARDHGRRLGLRTSSFPGRRRRFDPAGALLLPDRREEGLLALVERFDIEPYSDFSAKWSNFIGLVLSCIDAKFCKKIFVGKLLTRSTRFTCFCTAQTSIFQQNFVKLFRIFLAKSCKNSFC